MVNPVSTLQSETVNSQMENEDSLLEVRDLCMHFPIRRGLFSQVTGFVKAVDGVSFTIKRGETLGLVGESGCGKSTIGRCIVRAYQVTSGQMLYRQENGEVSDLSHLQGDTLRKLRKDIRMIFQDPYSSLNPRMTVFDNISEALQVNSTMSRSEIQDRVAYLLRRVGLRPEYMTRYPHAFSGGERQRIVVARALVTNPRLIVADEAVSALDVSVRAQILNLLEELQEEFQLTYLFISHDLSVIRHICDRVAVMYVGKLVETATIDDMYRYPKHPYTEALLSAVPITDPRLRGSRDRIQLVGEVADPSNPPSGCYFHPRCQYAKDRCKSETPVLRHLKYDQHTASTVNHDVSCHFTEELDLRGAIIEG
ncbi:MAG TPA: oligopeptide/dipeptide ABC transporter ATP-binding protein [Aggregatilineales bacterium]|nr:oligopeptide/dipeptide ABC transporter ATP-binding protein [Aggregatilineales bacterium]